MKNLTAWLTLTAISFLAVIVLGLWARLMVFFFCIGYGC